jgi:hypothetical protein
MTKHLQDSDRWHLQEPVTVNKLNEYQQAVKDYLELLTKPLRMNTANIRAIYGSADNDQTR